MAYHIYRRWGECVDEPTLEQMREALADLDALDDEHPVAWLSHESGWTLSAYSSGLLIWENLDAGGPMHMKDIPRDRVLELWERLSRGDVDAIGHEPWITGNI